MSSSERISGRIRTTSTAMFGRRRTLGPTVAILCRRICIVHGSITAFFSARVPWCRSNTRGGTCCCSRSCSGRFFFSFRLVSRIMGVDRLLRSTRLAVLISPQRWNRYVDNIVCNIVLITGTRIETVTMFPFVVVIQVDREEEEFGRVVTTLDNFFRPIPMVNINIDNCTSLTHETFVRNGVQGAGSNIVEDTEPTRFSTRQETLDSGMMSWWTNDTKRIPMPSDQDTIDSMLYSARGSSSGF
mmetsp:Transcript_2726/g.3753  ORF Transcript_2726/g.3753 Transcript_2726/m.3753 type:complete len:243 (+) Transcript_2726:745-1473(+)